MWHLFTGIFVFRSFALGVSFVSVCSNSECERNGCQNLTCHECPVPSSGSFSTWALGASIDATQEQCPEEACSMVQKRRATRPAVQIRVFLERVQGYQ